MLLNRATMLNIYFLPLCQNPPRPRARFM